jgi:hypothetical protein
MYKRVNILINYLNKYSTKLFALLVFTITLIVFAGVLHSDFVMWDDDVIIYRNYNIRKWGFDCVRWAFSDVDSMMRYNPLTLLGWVATYHFDGINPFWFHFGNWLLHGLSAVLLFYLILKLINIWISQNSIDPITENNRVVISAIVTLLWSIHPLRTEPVAWATDRTYCQALFFLLLSFVLYLNAVNKNDFRRYVLLMSLSWFAYCFSMLSYALGMTFFVVYFVVDIYLLKRVGGLVGCLQVPALRRVFLEKILFAVPAITIAIITVVVRVHSAGIWRPPISLDEFSLLSRIMQAMYVLAYYAWKPFYPFDLSPVYSTFLSFDNFSIPFVVSAVTVVFAGYTFFVLKRRKPIYVALGWSYFLCVVPFTGLFDHPHFHSDRYSLLSSIVLSIAAACLLVMVTINFRRIAYVLYAICFIAIICLGCLSMKQSEIWNDSLSLFSYMIKKLGTNNYRQDIYWRLGKSLAERGRIDDAILNYRRTLEINPSQLVARNNLAKLLEYKGRYDDAIYHWDYLLRLKPDNIVAHTRIASLYTMTNQPQKALYHNLRAKQLGHPE